MRALDMNRTPPLRAGVVGAATSARVAANIAGLPPAPPVAAAVMTGGAPAKRTLLGKFGRAVAKAVKAKATNPLQNTLVQALDENTFTVQNTGKQTLNLSKVPPKSTSSSSSSALPALFRRHRLGTRGGR